MQVKGSDRLVLKRYVSFGEDQVYGRDERGFVVLRESESTVYFSNTSITEDSLPHKPLSEKLADMLVISKKRENILLGILTTNDEDAIEDMLERGDLDSNESGSGLDEEDNSVESDDENDSGQRARSASTPAAAHDSGFTSWSTRLRSSAVHRNRSTSAGQIPTTPKSSSATKSSFSSSRGIAGRRANAPTTTNRPKFASIDVSDIQTAAANYDGNEANIVGPSVLHLEQIQHCDQETLAVDRNLIPLSGKRGSGRGSRKNGPADSDDVYNMPELRSALDSISESKSRRRTIGGSPSVVTNLANKFYHEVGFGGELFVRVFLIPIFMSNVQRLMIRRSTNSWRASSERRTAAGQVKCAQTMA